MTKRLGDIRLPYRHFERKREIFAIRGQVSNVWKVQNGKPAIERFWSIPAEPFEPIEPAEPLSHVIKGLHASGANLGKR